MGTVYLAAAAAAAKKPGSPLTLIVIVVLIGLFYLLILRPQRNRQRRTVKTQSQAVPGQKIRTTAGMYGTLISGDDRDVVVEIADGVQITMLRRAIMEVVPEDIPEPDLGEPDSQPHAGGAADDDVKDDTPPDDWDLKDKKNL